MIPIDKNSNIIQSISLKVKFCCTNGTNIGNSVTPPKNISNDM